MIKLIPIKRKIDVIDDIVQSNQSRIDLTQTYNETVHIMTYN